MSREAKFGGVTVRMNDDGSLFVYQPDSNRVLSPELAHQLVKWLKDRDWEFELLSPLTAEEVALALSTVPAGITNTSATRTETTGGTRIDFDPPIELEVAEAPEVKPVPKRRGRPPRRPQA